MVAWARDGLYPWRLARKHAIRLRRDGHTTTEICRLMVVPRQWVHKWWNRWLENGKRWDTLDDRPSRPRTIHTKRHEHQEAILRLRQTHGYGARKIRHLSKVPLSHTTIHRILQENGQTKKRPYKPRQIRRFSRPYANYLWQLDTCQIATDKDGWAYVQTLIDDHSRFVLASHTLDRPATQGDSIRLVRRSVRQWGKPKQILTDNGAEFHSIQRDEPGLFTQVLWELGIQHIRGRPRHPRTQGKIERWHRSFKHEWLARHAEPADHEEARRSVLAWLEHYNLERPHDALGFRVPVEVFLESLFLSEPVGPDVNEVA